MSDELMEAEEHYDGLLLERDNRIEQLEAENARLRGALQEIAAERPLAPGMSEIVHGRSAQRVARAALDPGEVTP